LNGLDPLLDLGERTAPVTTLRTDPRRLRRLLEALDGFVALHLTAEWKFRERVVDPVDLDGVAVVKTRTADAVSAAEIGLRACGVAVTVTESLLSLLHDFLPFRFFAPVT